MKRKYRGEKKILRLRVFIATFGKIKNVMEYTDINTINSLRNQLAIRILNLTDIKLLEYIGSLISATDANPHSSKEYDLDKILDEPLPESSSAWTKDKQIFYVKESLQRAYSEMNSGKCVDAFNLLDD